MIRIIDRYFFKEFIPPFFFSLFALTFILLMNELFRLIDLFVRKGLPIGIVGQILVYTLPLVISYTAPMAILVAVVMSIGRFSQENEILALKTSGFSFFSIVKIPLLFTSLFMVFLMLFNGFILPEANHRVRNLMLDVSRKRPAVRLPEGIFTTEFPGYTIYIGRKDEKHSRIFDVTIYDLRKRMLITAPRGVLKNFEEENILRFTLYDGELHQLVDNERYQRTRFEKQVINMKLNTELVRKNRKYRNEDELTLLNLLKRIDKFKDDIRKTENEIDSLGMAGLTSYLNGDIHALDRTIFKLKRNLTILKGKIRKTSRYLVSLNKKFSLAFACIVFILIGAPAGYLFKRGGIGGILIGVLLFSLYYILVIGGEEFADRKGFSPFWATWLPNIILIVVGAYLFWVAEYDRPPFK